MPFYQNSVIYKLCHLNDLDNENIYIGSTTNFKNRKHGHKGACNNKNTKKYNCKLYQFIRDNGGWDEWQMILIESFPCNNKIELQIRERYHIELLKSKLNQLIPTRTYKEYCDDNKETLAEKHKIYYNDNKERIAEVSKQYRENNEDRIKNYKAEKIVCAKCESIVTRSNLSYHKKTKKCIDYI